MPAADLTPTLEDAIVLAAQWHRGQTYPSLRGEPFILHPLRVMSQVESDVERIVAVLHDVIEDTSCPFDDLRGFGYSERDIDTLDRLHHHHGQASEHQVERCKHYPPTTQTQTPTLPH